MDETTSDSPSEADDNGSLLARARRIYRARRRRTAIFAASDHLFGEPAWDLLLDLYIATRSRHYISVSSACIAAHVPSTTALRWIAKLEMMHLVVRSPDPRDGRRSLLWLAPAGLAAMETFLREA